MRIIFSIKEILDKIKDDDLPGYAAQSCYFIILSFFPFVALLLSLIRFLPLDYATFISLINDVIPVYFREAVQKFFLEMYESSSVTLTSISAIVTLWAAGRGFMALMKGFNAIHGIKEDRNFFVLRAIASVQTLLFIVIILAMLVFVVFGNKLFVFTSQFFPYLSIIIEAIIDIKWLFFPALLTLAFLFMFKFIPSRRLPLIRQLPGAVISAIGWYGFSIIYAVYVNHNTLSTMYGNLANLIFALVWLYSCMLILFFGVEFNTLLEKKLISPHLLKRRHKR
ncbi:MAG: YihY/virulence factor BrkB family protein [Bacteroides sp.]